MWAHRGDTGEGAKIDPFRANRAADGPCWECSLSLSGRRSGGHRIALMGSKRDWPTEHLDGVPDPAAGVVMDLGMIVAR